MEVSSRFLAVLTLLVLSAACGLKKTEENILESVSSGCQGESIEGEYIVNWSDQHISFEKNPDLESFKQNFIKPNLDKIEYIERNRQIRIPNQPQLELKAMTAANSSDYWGIEITEVQDVWSKNVFGEGIVVGIVDTKIDVDHPQISGQILYNENEIPGNNIDDDQNGLVDDYAGWDFSQDPVAGQYLDHGTHVAGIVAADSKLGLAKGLAPKAKLIPSAFLESKGGSGTVEQAIKALNYAADRGAKIINNSWGGVGCSVSLKNTFNQLANRGILLIVASGNEASNLDRRPSFPASFNTPNQITVAASTSDDFMAGFSNSSFSMVHLAAPGVGILSTIPVSHGISGNVDFLSGTSMATPFVSAAAALVWSVRPKANYAQVRDAILSSVDVIQYHEYRVSTRGRLNIRKAVEKIKLLVP